MRLRSLIITCVMFAACRPDPEVTITKRYPDGRIAEVRGYTRGDKSGLHRGWWPNGKPKFECGFDRGMAEGTCREWYPDGTLATVHRFQDGVETGLQQGWSSVGAPQFSYVMRGGRRYGLLGALNCKTGARAEGAL
jgi:antitoxin component YwqK of YwqJK toxin-antitoxin module